MQPGRRHSGDAAVSRKLQPASGPTAHVGAWAVGGWLQRCTLQTAVHHSADSKLIAVCGLHDTAWKATHTGYSEHHTAQTDHQRLLSEHCWLPIPETTVLHSTIPVSIPATFRAVSRYSVYRDTGIGGPNHYNNNNNNNNNSFLGHGAYILSLYELEAMFIH